MAKAGIKNHLPLVTIFWLKWKLVMASEFGNLFTNTYMCVRNPTINAEKKGSEYSVFFNRFQIFSILSSRMGMAFMQIPLRVSFPLGNRFISFRNCVPAGSVCRLQAQESIPKWELFFLAQYINRSAFYFKISLCNI